MNSVQILLVLASSCLLMVSANRAPYKFAYGVNDPLTGDMKEQAESREGDTVSGYYKTLDSDGLMRTVNYLSHPLTGFQAQVSRNPIGLGLKTAGPAVSTQMMNKIDLPAPIVSAAPIMGTRIAAAAPIIDADCAPVAPLVESKMASTVYHDSPLAAIAPAPIIAARTAYGGLASSAAAYQWSNNKLAAAPIMETRIAAPMISTGYASAAPIINAGYAYGAAPLLRTGYAAAAAPMISTGYAAAPMISTGYAAAAPLLRNQYDMRIGSTIAAAGLDC